MKAKPAPKTGRSQQLSRSLTSYAYQPRGVVVQPGGRVAATKNNKPPKRWGTILRRSAIVLLILVLLIGGWVAWKFVQNEVRIFGWKGLIGIIHPEKLKGEDTGHVNILLAGNSADDPGHGGAELTDSIMIASIDPKKNTAFLLSIPRDLYVNIPNDGYAKINSVFETGDREHFSEPGYANGGMGLLQKVISQNFGITFHYYALVDYAAVRQGVDAVGGIDVTINSTDERGLYDPSPDLGNNRQPLVDLSNGVHHINGVQALGLARARGNHYGSYGYASGDFTRATNQRLIIVGLKDKGTSLSTLSNPIKLSQLFDAMGNNVQTDLSLGNVRRLYDINKKIPGSSVTSAGIDDEKLLKSRMIGGQYTLVPDAGLDDYSEIQAYVGQLLTQ